MCRDELHSTQKKKTKKLHTDISISSHVAGYSVLTAGVMGAGFSRVLALERVGWAWLNAKVRLSEGLWGWKEKQALLLKCCHSEYAAAALHYQCMSSPTASLVSLVWHVVWFVLALVSLCVNCVPVAMM